MADYLAVARRTLAALPRPAEPKPPVKPENVSDTRPQYLAPDDLPAWAERYERILGPGKHHRLLVYIGQRVQCPLGIAKLLNVFIDRCDVDLGEVTPDGRHKVQFYKPSEVEPIQ
jgi:hypothetical protein